MKQNTVLTKKLLLPLILAGVFGLSFFNKIDTNFNLTNLVVDDILELEKPTADYEIDAYNGQTVTVCSGNFYDSGGSTGNYSNNESYSITFCSSTSDPISLNFTSFLVENNPSCSYDELRIYDGTNSSASLLNIYCNNSPGTVTSSGTCLYLEFYSDNIVTEGGWAATISCNPPPAPEICNSGVDEDGDGLIDCADPDCSCLDALACYVISDEISVADRMFSVNPLTGVQTLIGSTGLTQVETMAIDSNHSIIYAVSANLLVTLNPGTGAHTVINILGTVNGASGPLTVTDIDGLTYDHVNDILWASNRVGIGSDGNDDFIFQINPITGNPITNAFGAGIDYLIVDTPEDDLDDLAIHPDGTLYAVSNNGSSGNQRLIIIDKTNGSYTDIGNYGISDVEGLSFTANGQLMATTGSGGSNSNEIHAINSLTATNVFIAGFTNAVDVEACGCRHADFIIKSIGNFVWADFNQNGIQDLGEPGLENIQVNLLNSAGNPVMSNGNPVTTTTNSGGFYEFAGLTTGNYIVEVVVPSGTSISPQNAGSNDGLDSDVSTTTNRTGLITVSTNSLIDDVDIGLVNVISARACSDAGELFVADETGNIGRYNATTGAVIDASFITGLSKPHDMVVGNDNFLYVSGPDNDEIKRFSLVTGALDNLFATSTDGLKDPSGLTIGPDGHLYVNNTGNKEVKYYNTTNGALLGTFVSNFSGGLEDNFAGIEFGPDGNLYVAAKPGVLRYNGTTGAFMNTFVSAQSGGLEEPRDLTFGPDGNLYVTSKKDGKVYRYNGSTGAFINTFVNNSNNILIEPHHLVFDGAGDLYVSDISNTEQVIKFNGTTGAYISTLTSGLNKARGMLFAPVPNCNITEICNNLIDDDGDGLIDCADSDCASCNLTCTDGVTLTAQKSTTTMGSGAANIPSISNLPIPDVDNRLVFVVVSFEREHCQSGDDCSLSNTAGTGLGDNFASPTFLTGPNQITANFAGTGGNVSYKNPLGLPAGDLYYAYQNAYPSPPSSNNAATLYSRENFYIALYENDINTILGGNASGNINITLPDVNAPIDAADEAIMHAFVFANVEQTNQGIVRVGDNISASYILSSSGVAGDFSISISDFDNGQEPDEAGDGLLVLGVNGLGASNIGGFNNIAGYTKIAEEIIFNQTGNFTNHNEGDGFSSSVFFRNGLSSGIINDVTIQSSGAASTTANGGILSAFRIQTCYKEVCNDNIDNDGDGLIDCADPDCEPIITNVAITQPTCANKTGGEIVITTVGTGTLSYSVNNQPTWQASNIFSGLGVGQYTVRVKNDSGCESEYTSNPIILDFSTCIEICSDGIDNDGDGLIDCDDPDCGEIGTVLDIKDN